MAFRMHLCGQMHFKRTSKIMIPQEEIESLGFKHIGWGWFENELNTIRIRQWTDFEMIIWSWSWDENQRITVFKGRLDNLEEVKWVLSRIII